MTTQPSTSWLSRTIVRIKVLVHLVLFYADQVSDIIVTVRFWHCNDYWWTILSAIFIGLPAIVETVWAMGIKNKILAITSLQIVVATWQSIKDGVVSHEVLEAKYVAALLEATPQLMLQGYVVFFNGTVSKCMFSPTNLFTFYASMAFSLLSISFGLYSYRNNLGWSPEFAGLGTKAFFRFMVLVNSCMEAIIRTTTVVYFCAHFKAKLIIVGSYVVGIRLLVAWMKHATDERTLCIGLNKLLKYLTEAIQNTAFITHVAEGWLNWYLWTLAFLFNLETVVIWWLLRTYSTDKDSFTEVIEGMYWGGYPVYLSVAVLCLILYNATFFILGLRKIFVERRCCFACIPKEQRPSLSTIVPVQPAVTLDDFNKHNECNDV